MRIQSGIGHTGKWWAFEHYGIKPDIMSTAKALQIGATAYDKSTIQDKDQHYQVHGEEEIGLTWQLDHRVIEVIKRDKLLDNATKMGKILRKGLSEMVGIKGIVDVRGLGLMVGVEFDTTLRRDKKLTELFKHGLLTLGAGQRSMRIIPPLIITKDQIHEGLG